jgi:hypothetical protein
MRTRKIVRRRFKNPLIMLNKSRLAKLRNILTRRYYMADFNYISPKILAKMIYTHAARNSEFEMVPVVLIGHSKSTYYTDRIHELVLEIEKRGLEFELTGLSNCFPGT